MHFQNSCGFYPVPGTYAYRAECPICHKVLTVMTEANGQPASFEDHLAPCGQECFRSYRVHNTDTAHSAVGCPVCRPEPKNHP